MQINIRKYESDMRVSDREESILQTAILNIISLVNALRTGDEIVMNASEEEDNIGYEVFLSHRISDEQQEAFTGQVGRQISSFLKTVEMPYEVTID